MKKISTMQVFGNEIFKEQKLTIGLDLGDQTGVQHAEEAECTAVHGRNQNFIFGAVFFSAIAVVCWWLL